MPGVGQERERAGDERADDLDHQDDDGDAQDPAQARAVLRPASGVPVVVSHAAQPRSPHARDRAGSSQTAGSGPAGTICVGFTVWCTT